MVFSIVPIVLDNHVVFILEIWIANVPQGAHKLKGKK